MENEIVHCIWNVPIKEKRLPKTWEEFCTNYPLKPMETYLSSNGVILRAGSFQCSIHRDIVYSKVVLPNVELAEAMRALCQLIQLRDCYNDGWKPNFTNNIKKYTIANYSEKIQTDFSYGNNRILCFETKKLRDKFFKNFRDLIEIAKPLI